MIFKEHNIKRAKNIAKSFKGAIKENSRILDIGLGNGFVAKEISSLFNSYVEGVDVVDYNETYIKNTLYDGLTLPFKDKSFDTILILQTLHHCKDQIRVLKEAKRVARKNIIITEDTYTNFIEKWITFLHDYISNKWKGVNCPYDFHSKKEWNTIFKNLKLKIVDQKEITSNMLFLKFRSINFVLEV